ncbi:plasmid partitioning protein (plasmid) [Streptomyces sp. NBC_00846]|uniref:ParB/RepB/Spo0J family partition protein n=1 Tax=Streptomyces sp. NBC_00846 TaxID=2975849 RepID=UPI0038649ACA|nr:plasmid partitioning protein [Streptomyces sp. NBC_00846]
MSVADRLGTGSSFGGVPRGRSARGRAKAVTQGDVPAYELVRLHLDEVSPTPLNPRRNFGTDEEKTRFGEELRAAQLAACVAVSRDVYLALWPEHMSRIGSANYVLVNGERRFRSAHHVGLEALDFVVRDDLAVSKEEFVNHLLKENLEREDFDVVERARGVQEMVTVCSSDSAKGAQARAAERLNKDRSWVTNQLALLLLPDEIQRMLSSGDMPERDGRVMARHLKDHSGLGAAELIAYLKHTKAREAEERETRKAILKAAKNSAPGSDSLSVLSADNTVPSGPSTFAGETTAQDDAPTGSLLSADNKGASLSELGPLLSADNTVPSGPSTFAGETTAQDDAPASSLLSADNKSASLSELGQDTLHTLSADNSSGLGGAIEAKSAPRPPADDTSGPLTGLETDTPPALSADNSKRPSTPLPHQSRGLDLGSLPWDDPVWFAEQLRTYMSADNRNKLASLLHARNES